MTITAFSLINEVKCDIPDGNIMVSKQYIELIQLNEFNNIKIIQCQVEIHRTLYYCGMHSHVSIVRNGEA